MKNRINLRPRSKRPDPIQMEPPEQMVEAARAFLEYNLDRAIGTIEGDEATDANPVQVALDEAAEGFYSIAGAALNEAMIQLDLNEDPY